MRNASVDVIMKRVEDLGFDPTPNQRKVKSAFWARYRDDPVIQPELMTVAEIQQLIHAPSMEKWWADKSFRSWFLNADEWRHQLEFIMDEWIARAATLLTSGVLSDKDFLQFGKLMADISGRASGGAAQKQITKELSPEQSRKLFHEAALSQGYLLRGDDEKDK